MNTDDHLAFDSIWKYRANLGSLSHDQFEHLYQCNDCLTLFGLCSVSKTLDEVKLRATDKGLQPI